MEHNIKLTEFQIDHDILAESDIGIDTIQAFGYVDGKNMYVHGEIKANNISSPFYLECLVFDTVGDLVTTQKNKSYGKSLKATNVIYIDDFFNGFPFSFTVYIGDRVNIGHIVIRPVLSC